MIDVTLSEGVASLEEMVVVGYGTQKKVNLTGAVDVISNEQIENRQANTVSQILQGLSPGLNFSTGNGGFEPGASMNINIRGIGSLSGGSPYVLIDNIPGNMDLLNPNDIESISVLKDAAASAIYGARAPYGVILITTKSGKKNEKMSVSYSGNVSVNTADRLPEMLDSYTYSRVINESGDNWGGRSYTNDVIDRIIAYQNKDFDFLRQFMPADVTHFETIPENNNTWANGNRSHSDHDWYEEFWGSSVNQNHNLSVKGGSEKATYYMSAGFLDQKGVLNYGTDTYQRYNVMGKVNVQLADWWDLRFETRFIGSPRERFNAGAPETGYDLLFRQVSRAQPTVAKYDGYGNYTFASNIPQTEDRGTDKTVTTESWQTLSTVLKPLNNWEISVDFAFQSVAVDGLNTDLTVIDHLVDQRRIPVSFTVPSQVFKIMNNNHYWVSNAFTSYDWQVNSDHRIFAMVGMQYEYSKAHGINVQKTNLVVQDIPSIQTATGDVIATENESQWSTQGYFSRLTYNFKEKYLLEANARYDGTSRFQEGQRWGFFPSFSLGWNIDKEPFWQPIENHINSFKLRASWGQLGNQQVAAYRDRALIPLQTGKLDWIFSGGGNRPIGYTSTPRLVSPFLTWETASTKNLGMDLYLFDFKLRFNVDLFERITENMIGPSEPLPGVLGTGVPQSNNATLRSRGWEMSARWNQTFSNKDISFFVGLNLHDVKTVVTDYLNPSGLISGWYPGKEVGEIWGYTANGLFQSEQDVESYLENVDMSAIFSSWNPGDVKYEDINGDGAVNVGANTLNNPGDLSIIGNNSPRYQFGFNSGVTIKNFDFSILINGTGKRDFFFPEGSNNVRFWGIDWLPFTALSPQHLDYFRDTPGDKYVGLYEGDANINLDAYFPKPYIDRFQNNKNRKPSTRYLVNAAYFRIQNVQVGYNLPSKVLSRFNVSKVRAYLSGENLFTSTNLFKGIDPIAITGYGNGAGQTYMADRIISFGLNVSL